METSTILLWGGASLFIVVVLGILLSKRNSGEKVGNEVPKECPAKEVMSEDEDEQVILCSRCGKCESTEEWNDAAVCEDCFDELDNEEEEDDWPKGKTPEYDDRDYSGSSFDLTSLIIGLIVLGITISIGSIVVRELGGVIEQQAINNTSNMTQAFEGLALAGSWLPIIFIVGMGAMLLSILMRAFGGMRDCGL